MIAWHLDTFKRGFFDREGVRKALKTSSSKWLRKWGAITRRIMKNSIKSKHGVSSPGTPPNSHTGILKKFILFAYEPTSNTVIVGAALTRKSKNENTEKPVPQLLNEGGWARITRFRKSGHKYQQTINIRPRPYVLPALAKARESYPKVFEPMRSVVSGGRA